MWGDMERCGERRGEETPIARGEGCGERLRQVGKRLLDVARDLLQPVKRGAQRRLPRQIAQVDRRARAEELRDDPRLRLKGSLPQQ